MIEDDVALRRQAEYLHRLFFKESPPPEVVERYIAANRLCCPNQSSEILSTILICRLDAEAIELVLRLRRGNSLLTRKIQILFYLVEVRSRYYSYFVSHGKGRLRVVLELSAAMAKTSWKLLKGIYLVHRYGLV